MENARDDIPALDTLDEPAFAGAEGIAGEGGATPAVPPVREATDPACAAVSPSGGELGQRGDEAADDAEADRQRREMHASFNDRISYLCRLAALVIAIVALATIALGQELPRFVLMGLCLSVALLAIASLQDYYQRRH